jgi:hypothetical protein
MKNETKRRLENLQNKYHDISKNIDCTAKVRTMAFDVYSEIYLLINKIPNNKYGIDLSGYDLDEDGNIISCCGQIVDPDVMRCPDCKENV